MGDSDRGQLKFAWGKFDAAAPWMCWSKAAALLLAQWSGLERENRIKRQMQFLHFVQTVDCLILLSLTRSFRVRVPFCLCAFASHKWGTKEATECFSTLLLMHACLLACLLAGTAWWSSCLFCRRRLLLRVRVWFWRKSDKSFRRLMSVSQSATSYSNSSTQSSTSCYGFKIKTQNDSGSFRKFCKIISVVSDLHQQQPAGRSVGRWDLCNALSDDIKTLFASDIPKWCKYYYSDSILWHKSLSRESISTSSLQKEGNRFFDFFRLGGSDSAKRRGESPRVRHGGDTPIRFWPPPSLLTYHSHLDLLMATVATPSHSREIQTPN